MDFEWDPDKRQSNLEKHGIDFVAARQVFAGPYIRKRSDRKGERRWLATGEIKGRIITVVYTLREGRIRIISARAARSYEREAYRSSLS